MTIYLLASVEMLNSKKRDFRKAFSICVSAGFLYIPCVKFFLILFSVAAFAVQGHAAELTTTTAEEYGVFLNTWPDAARSLDYFDLSFMSSTQTDGGPVSIALINASSKICIVSHNEYYFRYAVVSGRENQVIDVNGLSSVAKKSFLTWRKNPTVKELCDDINDQLAAAYALPQSGVAATIKSNYPDVSKWIFSCLDGIAPAIYNGENFANKEIRDGYHAYLTFSNADDAALPAGLPLHAVVISGMEWYRPSAITVDNIPPVPPAVVHVGKKSAYPIHDPGNLPVPIEEYVAYLQKMGVHDYTWEWLAWYYDTNLMDPKSLEYCVVRLDVLGYYFFYAVKEGCENFVIDGVTSSCAHDDFIYWTSRPTAQEICDYINDKTEDFYLRQMLYKNLSGADALTVFGENAVMIKKRYEDSPNANDIFNSADAVVQKWTGEVPGFLEISDLLDENWNTCIKVSYEESVQLPYLQYHLTVAPEFKYERPSIIQ